MMKLKPTTTILPRRFFQEDGTGADTSGTILSANSATAYPIYRPTNATVKAPFSPQSSSSVDTFLPLTILVLLIALFFMAFFSLYIRNLTADYSSSAAEHSRRNPSLPSTSNRKGLDPSAVKSLPLVSCSVAAKHGIEECTICLSEFEEREILKIIPYCKHVYHPKCIDTWLSLHVTCPLCRSPRLFESVDEVSLDMKELQKDNNCESGVGERSTVDDVAPWRDEERV